MTSLEFVQRLDGSTKSRAVTTDSSDIVGGLPEPCKNPNVHVLHSYTFEIT